MEAVVSQEIAKKLVDKLGNIEYNSYILRIYFDGDTNVKDEGGKNRINVKLGGSMFSGYVIADVWIG